MRPEGLIQPLDIPEAIWVDLLMDFIAGLPISNGYSTIMVVVDCLSKYAHFISLRHHFIVVKVPQLFLDNIIQLHGVPKSIVCDRDKVFTFGLSYFRRLEVDFARVPVIILKTEVVNRVLEQYLRCFTHDKLKRWVGWLYWEEFSYNTTFHSSTKMTPFEAVYGVLLPLCCTTHHVLLMLIWWIDNCVLVMKSCLTPNIIWRLPGTN